MATKKSTKSESKPGVVKVAEKIASIAGTVVGTKNKVVRKAGEVIDSAKAKLHDLTTAKKTAIKKVKKAAKKVKSATKKVVKKAASKAATAKKKVKTVSRKVKKAVKKAVK